MLITSTIGFCEASESRTNWMGKKTQIFCVIYDCAIASSRSKFSLNEGYSSCYRKQIFFAGTSTNHNLKHMKLVSDHHIGPDERVSTSKPKLKVAITRA